MTSSYFYTLLKIFPDNIYCFDFYDDDFYTENNFTPKNNWITKYFRRMVTCNKLHYHKEKGHRCHDKIRIDHQKDSVN